MQRAFGALALAAVVLLGMAAGAGSIAARTVAAPAFAIRDASVTPRHAYFAGRPVRIGFTLASGAAAAQTLQVDVVRKANDRPVRRFTLADVTAASEQRIEWDGVTGGGEVAPNGSYRVRVRGADGPARAIGELTLHNHAYPIRGPHADRGPIGAFGVGRNGGRTHEGYDVNAACGTPLVAARGGRVVRADYDPVLYGNVVIIRGERTQRDYWYSHMKHTTRLKVGDHVLTGQRIGSVGATGNARTIGCHLHFQIVVRGRPIDPAPELHAWDAWS